MQIQTGTNRTYAWNTVQNRFAYSNDPPDQVVQGWTGPELVQDRKKCIEAERGGIGRTEQFTPVRLAAPIEPGVIFELTIAGHDGRQLVAA